MATWEKEIQQLMKHFCLEKESKSVIAEVKANAKGNETDDELYRKAWNKFHSILMAS